MEKRKREEIPPLSPLFKGGAESGGITSPARGAESRDTSPLKQHTESSHTAYFEKDSIRKRDLTWNGFHLPYNSNNIEKARALRRKMTPAEKKLWYGFLRTFKYRVLRQRPIDHYIADFYCAKLKLVIEADGRYHLNTLEYDKKRSNIMHTYGLRILRFSNEQIFSDFNNVCKQIEEIPLLSPLEKGSAEGGGITSPAGGAEGGGITSPAGSAEYTA